MLSCDIAREVATAVQRKRHTAPNSALRMQGTCSEKSLRKKALSQHPNRRKRLPKRAHVLFFAPILFHAAKLRPRIAN
jgi:hypothetical protein